MSQIKAYILIDTDGYNISTKIYSSFEQAQAQMRKEFIQRTPVNFIDSYRKMSELNIEDAILYDNGNDVYAWKIEEIKIDTNFSIN